MTTTVPAIRDFDSVTDVEAWDYYEHLRSLGPVVRDEEHGTWLVTSYELIKQMSRDDGVVWRALFVYDEEYPPFGMSREELTEMMGEDFISIHEGAVQERMHRWWFRTLSPRVLAHWGDTLIEPIAHAQIDRFAADGRAELVEDFCIRVTPRVMAAVLGLPWDDDEWFMRFKGLHESGFLQLFQHQHGTVPDKQAIREALDAIGEAREMIAAHVHERRDADGQDLMSILWRSPDLFGGRAPTAFDVAHNAMGAYTAGSGSTGTVAGNGLYLMATRPGVQEQIVEGGARTFAEEALRLYGQLDFRPRRAKIDTELAGVPIKNGELVVAITSAANRDPARHAHPAEVDLDRPSPRDHFAFYNGPRTCPGQSLARFMLEKIFAVSAERLTNLRLDPDAEPPRWTGLAIRRWQPLHALFDGGAA